MKSRAPLVVTFAALQLVAAPSAQAHVAMVGMVMPAQSLPPEVSFPYAFPWPGTYRIFVQIKRGGRIETGVFDAQVE